jgi:flagellar basal-body rod modification protein FlgD
MASVDPTGQSQSVNTAATAQTASTLGKNDFLQLLVTQLKNQDPLDPVKNEDFIAQLAQFNSLEQMINLNTNFEQMNAMQSLTQATTFIGKQVVYNNSEGTPTSGLVNSIEVQDGKPLLVIGTTLVNITDVLAIANE